MKNLYIEHLLNYYDPLNSSSSFATVNTYILLYLSTLYINPLFLIYKTKLPFNVLSVPFPILDDICVLYQWRLSTILDSNLDNMTSLAESLSFHQ